MTGLRRLFIAQASHEPCSAAPWDAAISRAVEDSAMFASALCRRCGVCFDLAPRTLTLALSGSHISGSVPYLASVSNVLIDGLRDRLAESQTAGARRSRT